MALAFSQACENNKTAILNILTPLLGGAKKVLEIASGTGQHAAYFAAAMPHLLWQPSDCIGAVADLQARCQQSQLSNLLLPIHFDVNHSWVLEPVDAIFTANSLHIMGWPTVINFFEGVTEILEPGGLFCVYGPFNYGGSYSSDSNAQFDQWLKARNLDSGIRDFEAVNSLAKKAALSLIADYEMPANNRCLVWEKALIAQTIGR